MAVPIAFGIRRPVRDLLLRMPVSVGPFTIERLAVRVADGAGTNVIPEVDAVPEEVVVAGKGKPGRAVLVIGADLLARCSALVFDKTSKQVQLTCG